MFRITLEWVSSVTFWDFFKDLKKWKPLRIFVLLQVIFQHSLIKMLISFSWAYFLWYVRLAWNWLKDVKLLLHCSIYIFLKDIPTGADIEKDQDPCGQTLGKSCKSYGDSQSSIALEWSRKRKITLINGWGKPRVLNDMHIMGIEPTLPTFANG